MTGAKVLVVDDEPNICLLLEGILVDEGYETSSAGSGGDALALLSGFQPDCVLLDVWLNDMNGLDILEKIKQALPDAAVIMISGHASVDVAVQALKKGAFDFLEKPLGTDRVLSLVQNAVDLVLLRKENRRLKQRLLESDDMIGSGPAMTLLRTQILQAANTDLPVFIMGENGTGKELVAREIHRNSRRVSKAFVAVNCAAIPDALIESELFGHERGAFTGAVAQKKGRFEAANKGTLFLDEVIDLSLPAQAKVLRALQEQQFERVGGMQTIQVDVRVLAASNKDPHGAMRDKSFREDLFYRLHVFPVLVPALRDRKEDIPELVRYFIQKTMGNAPESFEDLEITPEGLALLREYSWPGNIRQLKNIVQRIMVMSNSGQIGRELVEIALAADKPLERADSSGASSNNGFVDPHELEGKGLADAREIFERGFILQKLEEHGYNITKAAEEMGMYPSHLHGKMKKLGIQTKK